MAVDIRYTMNLVSLSNSFVQRPAGIEVDGAFADGGFGSSFLVGG